MLRLQDLFDEYGIRDGSDADIVCLDSSVIRWWKGVSSRHVSRRARRRHGAWGGYVAVINKLSPARR